MPRHTTGLPHAPIENKVAVGTISGFITLILSWAVVNFIPGIKHASPDVKTALPGFLATLASFAGGWLAKHEPRLDEVLQVALEHMGQLQMESNTAGTAYIDEPGYLGGGGGDYATEPDHPAVTQQIETGKTAQISAADLGAPPPGQPDPYQSIWGS